MSFVLYVLVALFLLLVISGGYVFLVGCVRRKEFPWLDEERIKKTTYRKYYPYMCASDRWLKEHNAQDVYVNSVDGLKLYGRWIPAENPKGTVLLAHGYRSTVLLDFHVAYAYFHGLGMNLLVPDQRTHGKSEGKYITFGVMESKDMRAWIRFHNDTFGAYPMILYGISMGASTMIYLADEKLPENVRGIIADCGYTSPKDILSSVFTGVTHLPAGPSIWIAEWFARVFAKFSLQEKDTRKALAHTRYPVLLIHGSNDGFVPCQMSREGYDACSGVKNILVVEGADHGLSVVKDPEKYTGAVFDFLEKNVEGFQ